MFEDTEPVHPWQIFSGLFICFWLTSAYFDHFLFTGVFCIVFGVAAEIVTKTMYAGKTSAKIDKQNYNKSIDNPEIKSDSMAKNEALWTKAEAALDEEDDDVPPPLPDKDYETGQIDTLAEKLQALASASTKEEDNSKPENNDSEVNAECVVARQYNRTVSDEYNQNTSTVNCNLMQEMNIRHTSIEEEPAEQVNSDEEDGQEGPGIPEEKRIYAPDSSDDDDEDEDEDFVSREVNFDESESEDEDFDEYVSNTNKDRTPENSQSPDTKEDIKESRKINDEIIVVENTVSANVKEKEISDADLNLSDPAKKAAAGTTESEFKLLKT